MHTPRKLLLATDLTARSDRATARALLSIEQCGAEVVAVHVIDPLHRSPELASTEEDRARALLRYDLRAAPSATIVVEVGDPAERAIAVAHAHGCGLIVTGVAREDHLLGPTLGATVDKLVRTTNLPLLVVTERARDAYKNIVVAVDFSATSATAVRTAARWFPDAKLTLFHAFDVPPMLAVADPARVTDEFHAAARAKYTEFVREVGISPAPSAMLRRGDPDVLLRELSVNNAMDLVVMGTHGRNRIAEALLGSVAKRILSHLACDALLVP